MLNRCNDSAVRFLHRIAEQQRVEHEMTSEGSYELIAESDWLRDHITVCRITPAMVNPLGRVVRLLLGRNRQSDSIANSQALLLPKPAC